MESEGKKLLLKADHLRSLQRWQQAIDMYQSALQLACPQEEVFCRIGQCYYSLGKFEEAIEYAHKAIGVQPDLAFAFHLSALSYFALGASKKAEELEKIALANSPENPLNHWLLAKIYNSKKGFFRKKYAKIALTYALQGLSFAPFHTLCLIEKNKALLTLGRKDELERGMVDVIQSAPDSTVAFEHLGDIYTAIGKPDKATPYFKEALKLNPSNRELIIKSKHSKWDNVIAGLVIAFSFAASQLLRACMGE
ncbi:tetratricopeptide (TPR) repeat protein [Runella defluvii]|uniref:Tetratricopeptide (TPR) repeat protein n=1 Tax=Runella defluvii TaxID=370973 RepID=A0A7W5ZFB0_9BACT|nr:tetratricopeptide repeat protein [Runella defluvii]MBB3836272.1 tetratricopeptide (TPR) repeat protein [Runella defluvii]